MNVVVIKIGGLVAADREALQNLLKEIVQASGPSAKSPDFVLVHGGGKEVTSVSQKFGYEAEFRDGVRITSPGEMEVVDMVLGGKINIDLVRQAQSLGLNAVGLGGQDGRTFVSAPLAVSDRPDSRTGKIAVVDPQLLLTLLDAGYFPILHSTSMREDGTGLNVNADEAAQEVAVALKARTLLFISDIPGILRKDTVIQSLDADGAEAEIQNGTITGGMIPKVRSALDACVRGVGEVVIGGYKTYGDLEALLSGASGTTISA